MVNKFTNLSLAAMIVWGALQTESSFAQTQAFYKEVNLIGGYSDRQKWIGKKDEEFKSSLGFEYFRKFANDYGDFLTADLQARASYDSIESPEDAWALAIHNAWLQYNAGLGRKVILGHFDPSFGLEPVLDTHGTLFKTLAHKNIGFDKDWGVGLRGILGDYDYEISAQIGSGMAIRSRDGSHLLSARIGTPQTQEFRYGLSVAYGRVLESMQAQTYPLPELMSDEAMAKRRVGLDAQYLLGSFELKGEAAYGQNNDEPVFGFLPQIDYVIPVHQNVKLIDNDTEIWLIKILFFSNNTTTSNMLLC
ncbi:MAG: hypothetical protein JW847_04570, partial [Candidatus Omnitrophica bacterium]|nr:hypothetical protein [Candidatus Omnitrophota bacterium]